MNGHVVYRRRKTGQQLIIAWTKEMQMILDKYPENKSDYLLPVIRNHSTNLVVVSLSWPMPSEITDIGIPLVLAADARQFAKLLGTY